MAFVSLRAPESTKARDQFVAFAVGALVARCGAGSPARWLPPAVLVDIGGIVAASVCRVITLFPLVSCDSADDGEQVATVALSCTLGVAHSPPIMTVYRPPDTSPPLGWAGRDTPITWSGLWEGDPKPAWGISTIPGWRSRIDINRDWVVAFYSGSLYIWRILRSCTPSSLNLEDSEQSPGFRTVLQAVKFPAFQGCYAPLTMQFAPPPQRTTAPTESSERNHNGHCGVGNTVAFVLRRSTRKWSLVYIDLETTFKQERLCVVANFDLGTQWRYTLLKGILWESTPSKRDAYLLAKDTRTDTHWLYSVSGEEYFQIPDSKEVGCVGCCDDGDDGSLLYCVPVSDPGRCDVYSVSRSLLVPRYTFWDWPGDGDVKIQSGGGLLMIQTSDTTTIVDAVTGFVLFHAPEERTLFAFHSRKQMRPSFVSLRALHPTIESRDQFIALAAAVVVERCGAGSPARCLPPPVLRDIGSLVVDTAVMVATLLPGWRVGWKYDLDVIVPTVALSATLGASPPINRTVAPGPPYGWAAAVGSVPAPITWSTLWEGVDGPWHPITKIAWHTAIDINRDWVVVFLRGGFCLWKVLRGPSTTVARVHKPPVRIPAFGQSYFPAPRTLQFAPTSLIRGQQCSSVPGGGSVVAFVIQGHNQKWSLVYIDVATSFAEAKLRILDNVDLGVQRGYTLLNGILWNSAFTGEKRAVYLLVREDRTGTHWLFSVSGEEYIQIPDSKAVGCVGCGGDGDDGSLFYCVPVSDPGRCDVYSIDRLSVPRCTFADFGVISEVQGGGNLLMIITSDSISLVDTVTGFLLYHVAGEERTMFKDGTTFQVNTNRTEIKRAKISHTNHYTTEPHNSCLVESDWFVQQNKNSEEKEDIE
ncbi:hypothetical protein Pelo_8417 [Pelomyxa schiedti]|nr:hypothetical protein Pelo_8417 [Pelomyxa schiedti]